MLSFIAIVLIIFGGYNISFAFKKGFQKIGPIVVGLALIALGFYILPTENRDIPDVYYRK